MKVRRHTDGMEITTTLEERQIIVNCSIATRGADDKGLIGLLFHERPWVLSEEIYIGLHDLLEENSHPLADDMSPPDSYCPGCGEYDMGDPIHIVHTQIELGGDDD